MWGSFWQRSKSRGGPTISKRVGQGKIKGKEVIGRWPSTKGSYLGVSPRFLKKKEGDRGRREENTSGEVADDGGKHRREEEISRGNTLPKDTSRGGTKKEGACGA